MTVSDNALDGSARGAGPVNMYTCQREGNMNLPLIDIIITMCAMCV